MNTYFNRFSITKVENGSLFFTKVKKWSIISDTIKVPLFFWIFFYNLTELWILPMYNTLIEIQFHFVVEINEFLRKKKPAKLTPRPNSLWLDPSELIYNARFRAAHFSNSSYHMPNFFMLIWYTERVVCLFFFLSFTKFS